MLPVLALTVALVVEDTSPLVAAPVGSAARQATLDRGDWLEVRGERDDFLQVYDHRRERPGYVRPWRVRAYDLEAPATRAELTTTLLFLRDAPGDEALAIGYAALLLRAGGAGPAVHDAIGTVAERMADRASRSRAAEGGALARHLEVAAHHGVRIASVEHDGRAVLRYDGEAFRRVLAHPDAAPAERARAVLGLTRDDELAAAAAAPSVARAWNEWRAEVLAHAGAPDGLPGWLAGRLEVRRVEVLAALASTRAAAGDDAGARTAAGEAVRALARAEASRLAPEDRSRLRAAAVRAGAARVVTAAPDAEVPARLAKRGLRLDVVPGDEPGRGCVRLVAVGQDDGAVGTARAAALLERCTFGRIHTATLAVAASGTAFSLAVEPVPGWVEAWLAHRDRDGWSLAVVPPAAVTPRVGYVEVAGIAADGGRVALARLALDERDAPLRTFEVRRTGAADAELAAGSLARFPTFRKLAAPTWAGETLALR